MKVFYKHTGYKVASVLRFFFVKIAHLGKFRVKQISMIGRRCGVYIQGNGEIKSEGRIILNDDVTLLAKGKLSIGLNFGINSYSRIIAYQQIAIGDNVTIGQMVSILDHDHDYKLEGDKMILDGYQIGSISIGDNVWIGDKVTVLKNVKVGDNVVIGANTLVNKDVPSNCVIGGVPFKIIKQL